MGALNVLMAAREYGVRRMVHLDQRVYGTALYVPIDENIPPGPITLLGQQDRGRQGREKAFTVRSISRWPRWPFNTYGMRQSAQAVIPTIVTQVLTCWTSSAWGAGTYARPDLRRRCDPRASCGQDGPRQPWG
jgi:nucleoside-diphosphate-sugar epimerase